MLVKTISRFYEKQAKNIYLFDIDTPANIIPEFNPCDKDGKKILSDYGRYPVFEITEHDDYVFCYIDTKQLFTRKWDIRKPTYRYSKF